MGQTERVSGHKQALFLRVAGKEASEVFNTFQSDTAADKEKIQILKNNFEAC